jgi:hypothetical protein
VEIILLPFLAEMAVTEFLVQLMGRSLHMEAAAAVEQIMELQLQLAE